jgi:hypothetical protein
MEKVAKLARVFGELAGLLLKPLGTGWPGVVS